MRYEEQGIDPDDIVEDGAEMEWNGHKLTFVLSPCCTGCFFMDKGEVCPKCEDGIWIEKNPNPWHTGTPTEEGWYLLKCSYLGCSEYIYDTKFFTFDSELSKNVIEWQKIEEN